MRKGEWTIEFSIDDLKLKQDDYSFRERARNYELQMAAQENRKRREAARQKKLDEEKNREYRQAETARQAGRAGLANVPAGGSKDEVSAELRARNAQQIEAKRATATVAREKSGYSGSSNGSGGASSSW